MTDFNDFNVFDAQLEINHGRYRIDLYGQSFAVSTDLQEKLHAAEVPAQRVLVHVKPGEIMLCAEEAVQPRLRATVLKGEWKGDYEELTVLSNMQEVRILMARKDLKADRPNGFDRGDEVYFTFGDRVVHFFSHANGENLLEV